MALWGIYVDVHPEIDLGGERESLRELAERLIRGESGDVVLDDPPPAWRDKDTYVLRIIRLAPMGDAGTLIRFLREGETLVISGEQSELGRIVGGTINDLANEACRMTEGSVPTHLHLDPTSDPEHRVYSPDSTALTIHLADEE